MHATLSLVFSLLLEEIAHSFQEEHAKNVFLVFGGIYVPAQVIARSEQEAAAEKKTVRVLLLKLIEDKIQELEKKGLLPKGK